MTHGQNCCFDYPFAIYASPSKVSVHKLRAISGRSGDNSPNPHQKARNPYVPTNGPELGDLMDALHFDDASGSHDGQD